MNIKEQFNDLKNWASQNKILLVKGDFKQNRCPLVELPYDNQDSIALFEQIAENLEVKIIISEVIHFDTETFNLFQKTVDKINDEDIKEAFEGLRSLENEYMGYKLHFFNNGVAYKIENYSEEMDDFSEVQESVNEYIQENELEDSDHKFFSKENISKFGRQLAEHENYWKLRTRGQRETFARQVFSKQFEELGVDDFYGIRSVVIEAENIYDIEIKSTKEKEIKQKVRGLLSQGLTKVRIAAELEISKDTLNKYI